MPPRYRFTKDEIVERAFSIDREGGMAALTARSLADALSSSPKVIFGSFSGMDEIKTLVTVKARDFYSVLMNEALARTDMLLYRSCPLCYVKFAHDEKELFRLLFMRDRKVITPMTADDTLEAIYSVIRHALGVSRETAVTMHMKFSIFAYGLACLQVNSSEELDTEKTDRLLSENWEDLVRRYVKK